MQGINQRRQAQAIADAMLDPAIAQLREQQRARHAIQQRGTPGQRRIAGMALAGGAIGGVLAYAISADIVQGYLIGALGSAALTWCVQGLRAGRTTS